MKRGFVMIGPMLSGKDTLLRACMQDEPAATPVAFGTVLYEYTARRHGLDVGALIQNKAQYRELLQSYGSDPFVQRMMIARTIDRVRGLLREGMIPIVTARRRLETDALAEIGLTHGVFLDCPEADRRRRALERDGSQYSRRSWNAITGPTLSAFPDFMRLDTSDAAGMPKVNWRANLVAISTLSTSVYFTWEAA